MDEPARKFIVAGEHGFGQFFTILPEILAKRIAHFFTKGWGQNQKRFEENLDIEKSRVFVLRVLG